MTNENEEGFVHEAGRLKEQDKNYKRAFFRSFS